MTATATATLAPAVISAVELILVWWQSHRPEDILADVPAVDSLTCTLSLI